MVGMRDVAKKAGVSLSTVSLVVNGTGYVSADMCERVRAAMRELDYIPNELARNLARNRTNIVGVIVPTIRHPFFATLTAALQREFSARGVRTMLCSTADADKGEADYVDMLQRHMMDGIVMASHTEHPAGYWTSIGRPVVAFDRHLGEGIPSVGSDHEEGGRLIARTLIASGVRHVAMVGGPRAQFHDAASGTTFPTVRYYLTLERELAAAGVRYDYVEAGEVSDFDGYARAMRALFDASYGTGTGTGGADAGSPPVDAVVSSDMGAAMCVQEAMRRGLRIPEDVQVVAYDGTYLADAAGVRLTAVRQDFDAIASVIAARMTDLISAGASAKVSAPAEASTSAGVSAASKAAAADIVAASAGASGASSGRPGADRARGLVEELIPMTLRLADSTR